MQMPGAGDSYFYEWYVGLENVIKMLNPDSGIKHVVFQHDEYDTIDDVVVGYMRFYLWKTNSATSAKRIMLSIDDIGVEECLRNRGIGTKMMDELRTIAADWGVTSIHLYVDAPNESAQAYYKKCGFTVRNLGMTLNL